MGEGQRERETQNPKQALGSELRQPRARRGARTHGPRDRDLAEVGRLTDCATQAPRDSFFKYPAKMTPGAEGSGRGLSARSPGAPCIFVLRCSRLNVQPPAGHSGRARCSLHWVMPPWLQGVVADSTQQKLIFQQRPCFVITAEREEESENPPRADRVGNGLRPHFREPKRWGRGRGQESAP